MSFKKQYPEYYSSRNDTIRYFYYDYNASIKFLSERYNLSERRIYQIIHAVKQQHPNTTCSSTS